jgi:TolB protein
MIRSISALATVLTVAAPAVASSLGKFDMSYPYPAHDGKSIVFQGNFDGRWQLYVLDVPDGSMRRLHVSERDDTHPALSPDGRTLAFISNRGGNDDVHLLDLPSGAVRALAPHPGKDGHPKWSRDGQWLTFNRTFDPADRGGDGDSAIMRVRVDGSGLSTVTDSPRVETFPSFSPDGRAIVFIEWFPDAAGTRNRNGELVTVDITSGKRRRLTTTDGFEGHPYWGSSGKWIYFSAPVSNGSPREFAIHRIRPDGTGTERLTAIDGTSDFRAIPSDDERTLYFNISAEGRTLIRSAPLP